MREIKLKNTGARITIGDKRKTLGFFGDEHEAGRLVNAAIENHHGEFGCQT